MSLLLRTAATSSSPLLLRRAVYDARGGASFATRALVGVGPSRPLHLSGIPLKKAKANATDSMFPRPSGACCFSTSSSKPGNNDDESTEGSEGGGGVLGKFYEENRSMLTTVGLGAGGAVMLYGVTRGVYHMFGGFMSLTPMDMGYYGFMVGFCTAGLVGGGMYSGYRALQIYPDAVYQTVLRILRADTKTTSKLGGPLGGHIASSGLRAYKIDGGHVGFSKEGDFGWLPPRCQMIFDVRGELYDGLATVEAVKEGGVLNVTFVGLDVMNKAEDRILVQGDESRLYVKDQLRSLVSFKADKTKP